MAMLTGFTFDMSSRGDEGWRCTASYTLQLESHEVDFWFTESLALYRHKSQPRLATGWNDQIGDEIEQIVVLEREPFLPRATRVGPPAKDTAAPFKLNRRWVFLVPLGHAVLDHLRTAPAGSTISAKVRVDPLLPTGDVSPPFRGERPAEPLDPYGIRDGSRLRIASPTFRSP